MLDKNKKIIKEIQKIYEEEIKKPIKIISNIWNKENIVEESEDKIHEISKIKIELVKEISNFEKLKGSINEINDENIITYFKKDINKEHPLLNHNFLPLVRVGSGTYNDIYLCLNLAEKEKSENLIKVVRIFKRNDQKTYNNIKRKNISISITNTNQNTGVNSENILICEGISSDIGIMNYEPLFMNKIIKNEPWNYIKNKQILDKIITDLIKGVSEIHFKKKIHNDLKLDNLVLKYDEKNKEIKGIIADLGGKTVIGANLQNRVDSGHIYYRAQELFQNNRNKKIIYSKQKHDISNLGNIIYKIFTGKTFFEDEINKTINKFIHKNKDYKLENLKINKNRFEVDNKTKEIKFDEKSVYVYLNTLKKKNIEKYNYLYNQIVKKIKGIDIKNENWQEKKLEYIPKKYKKRLKNILNEKITNGLKLEQSMKKWYEKTPKIIKFITYNAINQFYPWMIGLAMITAYLKIYKTSQKEINYKEINRERIEFYNLVKNECEKKNNFRCIKFNEETQKRYIKLITK